jgi:hypothetical protein
MASQQGTECPSENRKVHNFEQQTCSGSNSEEELLRPRPRWCNTQIQGPKGRCLGESACQNSHHPSHG